MQNVLLPSGLTVSCLQKHDVAIVDAEVQSYFHSGIAVRPGDTVVDVGANIGLFALAAWSRGRGDIVVHCLEPVAPIFEILQMNLKRCHPRRLKAYPFGLSDRAGIVEFAYYPEAPVLSSAYPEPEADFEEVKQATLTNILYMPEAPAFLKVLRWIPGALREWLIENALRRTLRFRRLHCVLKTLSEFIAEQGIKRIDLLKIDAEKAEWDILRGIRSEDWARIRQVVVDVHDIDHRLDRVLALLAESGLERITIEQPPTLRGSTIHTLLATRP